MLNLLLWLSCALSSSLPLASAQAAAALTSATASAPFVKGIPAKIDKSARYLPAFLRQGHGLSRRKEAELQIGTRHAVLYQPLKEWIDLVDDWAKQVSL